MVANIVERSPTRSDPSAEDEKTQAVEGTHPVRSDSSSNDLVDDTPEAKQGLASAWKSLFSRHADLDAIATRRSVFDDPSLAKHYEPPAEYENVHRFDPNERWTYREERAVRRKIDLRILSWVLVMFFALNIDRGNLGLAVSTTLLKDLGLYDPALPNVR